MGRPVGMGGMPDVLSVQTEVTLVPAQSASAEVVGVWMGQERLEVATEPFRVTLDPDGRVSGEHALRVLSALGDREGVHAESVWVGELPAVTWTEVEEIHDRSCAECHNGQTHTILDSRDAWRLNIDRIIEVVSSGEMPLGANPIPDEDVVSVRAWKWGGFQ